MSQRQFDLIFDYIKSISKRIDELSLKVDKLQYELSHLPKDELVTGKLQAILTSLETEIKALKDEQIA